MKRFCFIIAAAGIILLSPRPAHALVIFPTDDGGIIDGYVYNVGPVSKDGIPDQIDTAQSVQVLNNSLEEERGVIEFNLAGFNDPVTSADLKLNAIAKNGPYPVHFQLYAYQGNGALDNSDFNAGTLLQDFNYSGETDVTFDVTKSIQDLKTANANFSGFNLRLLDVAPIQPGPPYVAFGSVEEKAPAQLVLNERVNAVPEPATMFLLGLGLVGGVVLKRRTS